MVHLHRRLIAFDLDGTLVDSRRDLANSANELIAELGGGPLSEDAIGRMVGEGAAVLVRRALTAAGFGDVPGALPRFLEIYDRRLLDYTRPYEGIENAVRAARAHSRVVVLTNKPLAPSIRILDALGMRELFDDVVGGDNAFGRKPDPAALRALMRDAGATSTTTLMVGDSAIDHRTAVGAGVRACVVTYGFGFETFPRASLTGEEWVVDSTRALRDAIDEFGRDPSAV